MTKRIVCFCSLVDEAEIISYLKKGASSTTDIQQLTKAGTTCGRCLPVIDEVVLQYQKKQKPKDQQGKLEFEL